MDGMPEITELAAQHGPNLLSMIGMFITERRHHKSLKHQDLLEWLENHHFHELKNVILQTHGVTHEIDLLLQAGQSEILGELSLISKTVSQIASRMDIIGGLAHAVSPNVELSEQATEILKLLDQATEIFPYMHLESHSMNANLLRIGLTTYNVSNSRFLREDFTDLMNAGFIMKHMTNGRGEPMFGITRLGSSYASMLPSVELKNQEAPAENPA